jgi:hypothetical protein
MPTIFLDNDQTHINEWNRQFPNSRTIKIDDTTLNPLGDGNTYYNGYITNYGANTYTELLRGSNNKIEPTNPSNGIIQADVTSILNWVHDNTANRIAVFDWDRTLSVLEGAIMPIGRLWNDPLYNCNPADALNYMFGGTERVELIKNMFITLHSEGVEIFIITNSANAQNNRPTMLQVIKLMDPLFVDDQLIYSGAGSGGGNRYTPKATALKRHISYINIPQELKGGRKRKTRKTRKTKSRGKRRASKTSRR